MNIDTSKALEAARQVSERAYAPYSKFKVGATLVVKGGEMFTGCNVENVSFGLSMCAERVALGNALQSGKTAIQLLALFSDSAEPVAPCGACRQVLAEFNPELTIVSGNLAGATEEFRLAELLPKPRQGILG